MNHEKIESADLKKRLKTMKAVCLDIFGTSVDLMGPIKSEVEEIAASLDKSVDGAKFAREWISQYGPYMKEARNYDPPWRALFYLHEKVVRSLLPSFGLDNVPGDKELKLGHTWERLTFWPDVKPGLIELRNKGLLICPFSNGDHDMLREIGRFNGFEWDDIFSAQRAKAFKQNPQIWSMPPEILGIPSQQIMFISTTPSDLKQAHQHGYFTVFVPRDESGMGVLSRLDEGQTVDLIVPNFIELAHLFPENSFFNNTY